METISAGSSIATSDDVGRVTASTVLWKYASICAFIYYVSTDMRVRERGEGREGIEDTLQLLQIAGK